jgi:hypothetical protein
MHMPYVLARNRQQSEQQAADNGSGATPCTCARNAYQASQTYTPLSGIWRLAEREQQRASVNPAQDKTTGRHAHEAHHRHQHCLSVAVQERLLAAQEQYEVLKERNQTELVRLNLQRAVDFRHALSRFAQVCVVQAELRPWRWGCYCMFVMCIDLLS